MSDKSKIEWTTIVDRGGRRVRHYVRRDPNRPGQQQRRLMAAAGLAWCRGCSDWLPRSSVRSGVCRIHANAEYRTQYALGGKSAIAQRVHARKRSVGALPRIAIDHLTEQFRGRCTYCPAPATTWDHVVPISRGGLTTPGNMQS